MSYEPLFVIAGDFMAASLLVNSVDAWAGSQAQEHNHL